ncbi:cyclic pyranopterin monophosphate synthase MoaC [Devosia ginsengisoli]|uniref:Cyclic pyranopterin monophosphate synthase n=1 Tax=Devosia ginsengisoli TaxID=400770 RepID=A0A5B8LSI1_9HYPH|nr:cyclic pyranopterin monophosphate synthase MoaC [Devosia ginsengisoli]QDZ10190.1 cyclic pyranopterin monophosphate synthase MoaC [Devosia ginsengisoli]
MAQGLTHLNDRGEAHMVDIGDKPVTRRRAVAEASVLAEPATVEALLSGSGKKGDAIATARIAGIMAAKKTAELIPLCHPLALTRVTVEIEAMNGVSGLHVVATAETVGQTGVEMEALTAASVAALTLYDMGKAMEKGMTITDVRLVEKSGGKSGDFLRA